MRRTLFTVEQLATRLLFPDAVNQVGYDTGIRIRNTGAGLGICTLMYSPTASLPTPPPNQSTNSVLAPGGMLEVTLSAGGTGGIAGDSRVLRLHYGGLPDYVGYWRICLFRIGAQKLERQGAAILLNAGPIRRKWIPAVCFAKGTPTAFDPLRTSRSFQTGTIARQKPRLRVPD